MHCRNTYNSTLRVSYGWDAALPNSFCVSTAPVAVVLHSVWVREVATITRRKAIAVVLECHTCPACLRGISLLCCLSEVRTC